MASAKEAKRAPAPTSAVATSSVVAQADVHLPEKEQAQAREAVRIVAFGDVHGDLPALHRVLEIAGLFDAKGNWLAGATQVVQTGDLIDRGDDDRAVLDEIEALMAKAKRGGGRFHVLNGNHEIMNTLGDLRYVTKKSLDDYDEARNSGPFSQVLAAANPEVRGRLAAFLPGGRESQRFAQRPIVLELDGNVFVHGGIEPQYARDGLDAINEQARKWLSATLEQPPALLSASDGPLWSRRFSQPETGIDCEALQESLHLLGAKRMILGHSVQKNGIQSACKEKVWLIDVGMSKYYGGRPQALSIVGDSISILE
jgi:hypothetical protein